VAPATALPETADRSLPLEIGHRWPDVSKRARPSTGIIRGLAWCLAAPNDEI
jgi:hypothetical protein